MFREQVEVKNNKISITISCELRTLGSEPKVIYDKSRIDDLIEEKYRSKVTLEQEPKYEIGNFSKSKVKQSGTWIFKIRQTRKKVSTPTTKNDILTKKQ